MADYVGRATQHDATAAAPGARGPQPQPMQVMSYATLQPSNHAAVLSLVFGLLFFVPLFAPGNLAVVLGRRGVRVAKEQAAGRLGLARAGIVLGVLNLVLS